MDRQELFNDIEDDLNFIGGGKNKIEMNIKDLDWNYGIDLGGHKNSNDLNLIIGGGKMDKPKAGGIDFAVRKEIKFDEAWMKAKVELEELRKEDRLVFDQRLRNAQNKIIELENQNVMLAKVVIKHRKREAQIAELMGWQKAEKR